MLFVFDAGFAFALSQIEPCAETVVFAETLAQVQMLAHPAVGADIRGEATGRGVLGALGLQVHAAADAGTGRRHAIDKGVGPFEHFDSFQRVGGNDLTRQHTVQTVVGNILARKGQATDGEHLG